MNATRLILVASLLATSPALAATVSLIPTEATGHESIAVQIDDAIREGLDAAAGDTSGPPVEITLDDARTVFACFDNSAACMAKVGEAVGGEHLIWGSLQREGDRWTLKLHRIEVSTARVVRVETVHVPAETDNSELEYLRAVALAFGGDQPLPRQPVILMTVRSQPPGGEVRVDGQVMGVAPLTLPVRRGIRLVEVRMGGHEPMLRSVEVGSEPLHQDFDFAPAPPVVVPVAQSTPPPSEAGGSRSAGFWAGVGTGVGAIGAAVAGTVFGVQTMALREKGNKASPAEYDGIQDDFESARAATNISFAIAGVLAVTSVCFFVFSDDDEAASASLTLTPGGMVLGGRF